MNLKELILNNLKEKKQIKIADIVKETDFSRTYIHRFFKELQKEGKIILVGRTNQAHYILNNQKKPQILFFRRTLINKNISEDIILEEIKKEVAIFNQLKRSVIDILDYAFTEMLNNAIEYSKSKKILVQIKKLDEKIEIRIIDWGVGIFNDIKKKFKLKSVFEAIELLLKGKQSTRPKTHTGEGIFFTSKAVDKLTISGSNKKLIFNNIINDVFVKTTREIKGTKIIFEISIASKRDLSTLFKEYTNENFIFDKTKVTVKLFELEAQSYVSRSQARRLLYRLEKFQRIVLDFKKVETVGQAFADEIFRVWQEKHPEIKIEYINCGENIKFMIKRALNN